MSRARAWALAARPATLWAAVTPVVVGGALAEADEAFRLDVFAVTLAAAIAIQVGVNFANDAADAGRGADSAARVGPLRAVAGGLLTTRQVWVGVAVAMGVAAALGVYLIAVAGWPVAVIGAASIAAALGYTSGPAYGYHALGEVFVFVFFGLVATVGSRYVHDGTVPATAWLLAVPVGMLVTAILVANNVRDLETDRAAGKRTLAVVLGDRPARLLYAALTLGAFVALALAVVAGALPGWAALGLGAAPAAVTPVRTMLTASEPGRLVAALVATARLHAAFGLLLAAGLVLS